MDTFEGAEFDRGRVIVGVYKLIHHDTGKFYIGSTGDFHTRRRKHIERLRSGIHHCKELQELYNETPHFVFELDSIGVNHSDPNVRERAYEREQALINEHWHNLLLLNKSRNVRYPDVDRTEESEAKRLEGIRQAHQRPEVREKVTQINRAIRRSEKAREQQSTISKSLWKNNEHRERMESVWKDQDYLKRQVENQPTSKAVIAAGKQYGSVSQAAKSLGVGRNLIKRKIKDTACSDYYWIEHHHPREVTEWEDRQLKGAGNY